MIFLLNGRINWQKNNIRTDVLKSVKYNSEFLFFKTIFLIKEKKLQYEFVARHPLPLLYFSIVIINETGFT